MKEVELMKQKDRDIIIIASHGDILDNESLIILATKEVKDNVISSLRMKGYTNFYVTQIMERIVDEGGIKQ